MWELCKRADVFQFTTVSPHPRFRIPTLTRSVDQARCDCGSEGCVRGLDPSNPSWVLLCGFGVKVVNGIWICKWSDDFFGIVDAVGSTICMREFQNNNVLHVCCSSRITDERMQWAHYGYHTYWYHCLAFTNSTAQCPTFAILPVAVGQSPDVGQGLTNAWLSGLFNAS